jgi:hypothetical protein
MTDAQTKSPPVGAWQAATIIAIVLAAGALVVAIVAVSRPRSAPTQNVALSGEIRSVKSELATARNEATSSSAALAKDTASISKITTCLPELSGEINGLTAEVTGGNVFLSQHNQVSSFCSSTLEKH